LPPLREEKRFLRSRAPSTDENPSCVPVPDTRDLPSSRRARHATANSSRGRRPPNGAHGATLGFENREGPWPPPRNSLTPLHLPHPSDCSAKRDRLGPRSLPSAAVFAARAESLYEAETPPTNTLQRNFDLRAPRCERPILGRRETAISLLFEVLHCCRSPPSTRIATRFRVSAALSPV